MKPVKSTTVLYMDDDVDDLQLLQEAFSAIDETYSMMQAQNGEEGLRKLFALKQEGSLPCLIVLDINMPKLDGRATFQKIKEDAVLSAIPVVIFSTSDNPKDRNFFTGANVEYMTKPVEYALLLDAAKKLLNYCSN